MDDNIEIGFVDRITQSPACMLATRGWLENVEKGQGEMIPAVAWDHRAFLATVTSATLDRVPVGVITWQHIEWRRELFVMQSYVLPAWRGRGIYRRMWESIVAKARELGAARISSITHADNKRMREIAAAQGRVEEMITLTLSLKDDGMP